MLDGTAIWDRFLIVISVCAIFPILVLRAVDSGNPKPAPQQVRGAPQCVVKGSEEIRIICDYSRAPSDSDQIARPRIALDHASFFFDPVQDSQMKIELTLTNEGATAVSEPRTVYLGVEAPDRKNYLRRPLAHVDLRKIAPHQTLTFSEVLLSPAFPRGTYLIHLWIPSSDLSLKFDATHNLLLNNIGVPDSATGLNTLATFTVAGLSGSAKHSD